MENQSEKKQQPSKKRWGLLITVLALLVSLVVVGWVMAGGSEDEAFFEAQQIILLENLLKGKLDPETRASLERKLEIARRSATAYVESKNNPADKEDLAKALLPAALNRPFPTGIFEGGDPLIEPAPGIIENRWQEVVNGQYITVLAGSLEDSPEQGIIYVVMTDPAQKTGTFEEFPSPQKAGSLRITKAENTRLIIQASNGAIFYFDVPGRQFAASMKVAIATITPLPPRPENTTLTEAPYPAPEKGEAPPYPSP